MSGPVHSSIKTSERITCLIVITTLSPLCPLRSLTARRTERSTSPTPARASGESGSTSHLIQVIGRRDHMGRRAIDMMGYVTEHARVIGAVASSPGGAARWALECICGTVFRADGNDIRRRPNMSCGCRGKAQLIVKKTQTDGLCQCCDNAAIRRGLCQSCHYRAKRRGVLESVALPPMPNGFVGVSGERHPTFQGSQSGGERGYNHVHARLRRERGRAADVMCAESCGNPARQWSYDGYCPGEQFGNATNDSKPWCPHLDHYQPRCLSCHQSWDMDQDYVAQAS